MLNPPEPGRSVRFRALTGHLAPRVGRPAQYYVAGQEYTEVWTFEHHSLMLAGAIEVLAEPKQADTPPPADTPPQAADHPRPDSVESPPSQITGEK